MVGALSVEWRMENTQINELINEGTLTRRWTAHRRSVLQTFQVHHRRSK
jgi:hypothetical protein